MALNTTMMSIKDLQKNLWIWSLRCYLKNLFPRMHELFAFGFVVSGQLSSCDLCAFYIGKPTLNVWMPLATDRKRGWGGWEQERHRLASSAPSTAWLYATANSLCHSSALLHLRALRNFEGRRERGNRGVGWKYHGVILVCDVICRYHAQKQSSIFWGNLVWQDILAWANAEKIYSRT